VSRTKPRGRILLHASSTGNIYPLAIPESSHSAFAALVDPATSWHCRPGHCGVQILSSLKNRNVVSFPNKFHDFCNSCRLAKPHRLPFTLINRCCQQPLEIIHFDLWQSPVLSTSGYRYYIFLVDDFSHYTWLYH